MKNKEILTYLIDLIDDDTREVRDQVMKELTNYGISLELDLAAVSNNFDITENDLIKPIIEKNRKMWLLQNWNSWQEIEDDSGKLEAAMNIIAKYQSGLHLKNELALQLDELTEDFKKVYPAGNEVDLADFLFLESGYSGEKKNYYDPLNSNIIYVLKEKKGIPISLAIIYMLVGNRLGFEIEGCNFPGHFLSKIEYGGKTVLVDCFNNGRRIFPADLKNLAEDSFEAINYIVSMNTSALVIVRRVLNNIVNAYKYEKDAENSSFFEELLKNTSWETKTFSA
ncbi:MAG: transglutaminase-like domain-containing protein [Melioribacteraceae bacterium]|nr:transglutaminase-like domain-containing protein [Melioribacteraceae bacterium]MCF8355404.1 transglutaminase-like domain-containing protein [Melioribacteraceae bacterium]MCF8393246.1 transglutaminase-like domain-containing protein [Melioribacteraceae bacterium]MCF8417547.1 transglutaminase-like domain-containing protein [Melioribacteraceae bacterium]